MKFPFMLVSVHEDEMLKEMEAHLEMYESQKGTINLQNTLIDLQKERISTLTMELEAIKQVWADHKCNHYTSHTPQEQEKGEVPSGRSGWRSRSQLLSERTIPKPADSLQALEIRVKEQGGKTDAV